MRRAGLDPLPITMAGAPPLFATGVGVGTIIDVEVVESAPEVVVEVAETRNSVLGRRVAVTEERIPVDMTVLVTDEVLVLDTVGVAI